jgi:hypothetical protein
LGAGHLAPERGVAAAAVASVRDDSLTDRVRYELYE